MVQLTPRLRALILEDVASDAALMSAALRHDLGPIEREQIGTWQQFVNALDRTWDIALADFSLADVDDLKAIDDSYGHAQGEVLLQRAAGLLCGTFRKEGAVARIGGDEFAVLLAGADAAAAQHAVERLARRLDDHNRTTDGPPLQPATGAATGEMGCRPAELLAQADAVMYGDKRDGRTDRGGDSGSEGGGT